MYNNVNGLNATVHKVRKMFYILIYGGMSKTVFTDQNPLNSIAQKAECFYMQLGPQYI